MKRRNYLFYLRYILAAMGVVCLIAAFGMLGQHMQQSAFSRLPQIPSEVKHKVLVLSSYEPTYFTFEDQEIGLKEGLYPNGIEFDTVYMNTKKFGTAEDIETFHDYFKDRFLRDKTYEGVLVGDDDALKFALRYQKELFDGMPLVFYGINDLQFAKEASRNPMVAGFYEKDYLQETMETAVESLPDRKTLVALHDESAAGIADMNMFYSLADQYPDYTFIDIDSSTLSQEELIRSLQNLPKNSILFYMTCYNDKYGTSYSMLNRTRTIVNNVTVPIFRNYSGGRDAGVLGGTFMDFKVQTKNAAQIMCDVLNDDAEISEYSLILDTPSMTEYNYPLVMEYGIPIDNLPKDTIYIDRPTTFFDNYSEILPVALLMISSMVLFIAAMYAALKNEKKVNEALRDSKEEIENSHYKLQYQAQHDEFLDVFNRRAMVEYLNDNVTMNQVYSIIMLDIDGFKDVNENYGHEAGDKILKTIADHLQSFCHANGMTLGRYGGDEFLIYCPSERLDENSKKICDLKKLFSQSFTSNGINIVLSASMGISNSDGLSYPEQHIINAEIAMYEAKERGRGMIFVYADVMKDKVNNEEKIKTQFIKAMEKDGFYMKYQPKVSAETKELVGFEALIRMKDGSYEPNLFIPVVEKSGWITRLGRHVTFMVVKQLSEWMAQGKKLYPISINFSSKQIHDIGYVSFLKELLDIYDVDPKYLQIEFTESLLLENSIQTDDLFEGLKRLGIKTFLDDFGTGYSSLAYLIYVPVDDIKLDKSLVDAYLIDGKDSFIEDVIKLVHDMGKTITIEGVEYEWQYEKLRKYGADTIQGYYFSKPLDPNEAISFEVKK